MPKQLISVVVPCMNEEGNVDALYEQVADAFSKTGYDFELLFADNASTDGTQEKLRALAAKDKRVKVIFNMRNFGHIRSPYNALMQAKGDAIIAMVADLQDPPELIPEFLKGWSDEGYKIVLGQKTESQESGLFFLLRSIYYKLVKAMAEVPLLEHITGFGLYDREVIEQLRALNDPYPYVRGLISEFGYPVKRIAYKQQKRKSGVTKNNFYTLFDMAMLGFTSHSKVPLRLASLIGFACAILSLLAGLAFFVYKLFNWSEVSFGVAPMAIGLFFFSSVQLMFLGVVGEYVGAIHTQVQRRPLVVERERLNFDE